MTAAGPVIVACVLSGGPRLAANAQLQRPRRARTLLANEACTCRMKECHDTFRGFLGT